MKLKIKTLVDSPLEIVEDNFNQSLFEYLSPPFPKARLLRYDGNEKENIVHLQLHFLLFKNEWLSEILESKKSLDEFYFIDVGRKLPFFLGKWTHKHLLQRKGNKTNIIDDVEFEAPIKWLTFLVYPMIYALFLYRIPAYKRYFKNLPRS